MIIMAAPNGARRGKKDHPRIPLTLTETVETARACYLAGANALHLHIRDENGKHLLDHGAYREALIELERTVPQMRIQVTTEAADIYSVEQQLNCLEKLQPGWASIAVKEAARDPDLAPKLYDACRQMGTEIQHIIYDADDAGLLASWQRQGMVDEGASVILVLGRYSQNMQSDWSDLPALRASLPPIGKWMLCAFGSAEHRCLLEAARVGGDLRVGFENSIQRPDGTLWSDMSESVSQLMDALARQINFQPQINSLHQVKSTR